MTELKNCPFCGSEPEYFDNSGEGRTNMCWCTNRMCSARDPMTVVEWNTRPLEDALQSKLEIAVEALNKVPHEGFIVDGKHPNGKISLHCPGCMADVALAEIEKVGNENATD